MQLRFEFASRLSTVEVEPWRCGLVRVAGHPTEDRDQASEQLRYVCIPGVRQAASHNLFLTTIN
jgi:hypothetical protein